MGWWAVGKLSPMIPSVLQLHKLPPRPVFVTHCTKESWGSWSPKQHHCCASIFKVYILMPLQRSFDQLADRPLQPPNHLESRNKYPVVMCGYSFLWETHLTLHRKNPKRAHPRKKLDFQIPFVRFQLCPTITYEDVWTDVLLQPRAKSQRAVPFWFGVSSQIFYYEKRSPNYHQPSAKRFFIPPMFHHVSGVLRPSRTLQDGARGQRHATLAPRRIGDLWGHCMLPSVAESAWTKQNSGRAPNRFGKPQRCKMVFPWKCWMLKE